MTTVGFGDIFATTFFGRLVCITAAIWGAFLISLIIVSVAQIFNLN
jgi:hypothetical protein